MNIRAYLSALDAEFAAGKSTEHSHRPALHALLEEAAPGAAVTNEPKQIECGAPDFLLRRGGIPLGYIETKDIGKNLDDKAYRAQFKRYAGALDNLIITDYLEFRLFRDGAHVDTARIGEVRDARIAPRRAEFAAFEELLANFIAHDGVQITTPDALAAHMAGCARMLAASILRALEQDEAAQRSGELRSQVRVFREHLIHDMTAAQFADMYAQTIAYGMFAARLHDDAPGSFTREKAATLIPSANPFLRKFFQHIAGYDLDRRIVWIVDALAAMFRAADVEGLMAEYGKRTRRTDPFLHFYETFLSAYNASLRKSRGVYYTPEPVVDFIVRAVDDILRDEFNLPNGIAAAGKSVIEIKAQDGRAKEKREMHKVQILDPAAGTGTFLAAIIRRIHRNYFAGQQGAWRDYVREELIPRLNGFEYLMAPYVMAHIKLEMVLRETGCELPQERMRVFLTNALEEHHPDTGTLLAEWLSAEAREANSIKRETPVMVVIGNPPYAVKSSNRGEWIQDLLREYKKDLNERKLNLDDDYIKFIRYGEHVVQKTGDGILAYISNNSFLDGITHRQMRKTLLATFDKVYILDLHGNTRKKETAPDGSKDENVFDIMQGVSIHLFVKTGKKKAGELARVFHHDLYGSRDVKYDFLQSKNLGTVAYEALNPVAPYFFFAPKDFSGQGEYEKGFKVSNLFTVFNSGVKTDRDALFIGFDASDVAARIKKLLSGNFDDAFKQQYQVQDSSGYKLTKIMAGKTYDANHLRHIMYRPFDFRSIYYDLAIISRPGTKTTKHILAGDNVGLLTSRTFSGPVFDRVLISRTIANIGSANSQTYHFPLYLYPETAQQTLDGKPARKPNLEPAIVAKVAAATGLRFTPEKEHDANKTFAPIDLLDYIYAVLHTPSYRARYAEFLKIDFPRVPYPAGAAQFTNLAKLGAQLRALHLMEAETKLITTYPLDGDNIITTRIRRDDYKITDAAAKIGRVHINARQYFGDVPETAWNFFIGGYQPAQKYLKDRRGRKLTHHDIHHYQKIIAALAETARTMTEIEKLFGEDLKK